MARAELRSHQRSTYGESLLVGGCFALGALLPSALIILLLQARSPMGWLILTSLVAAFITGTILWRNVFTRGRRPTLWRGAGVGALVVIVANPLAWYLLFLLLYYSGVAHTFPARTVHPLSGLAASLIAGAMGLVLFGWITIPIGGAIGGGLGRVSGKGPEKSA